MDGAGILYIFVVNVFRAEPAACGFISVIFKITPMFKIFQESQTDLSFSRYHSGYIYAFPFHYIKHKTAKGIAADLSNKCSPVTDLCVGAGKDSRRAAGRFQNTSFLVQAQIWLHRNKFHQKLAYGNDLSTRIFYIHHEPPTFLRLCLLFSFLHKHRPDQSKGGKNKKNDRDRTSYKNKVIPGRQRQSPS